MSKFKDFLTTSGIEDQNFEAGAETVSFTNKNERKFSFLFNDVTKCLAALWINGEKVESVLKGDWKYEETKFRQAFGAAFALEGANAVASSLGSQTPNIV